MRAECSGENLDIIKSCTILWDGNIEHTTDTRKAKFWSEHLKGREQLENLGIEGRTLLK